MNLGEISLAAAPLLPWPWLAGFAIAGLLLLGLAWQVRARGAWWRAAALAGLLITLLNPMIVREERQPLTDVALIVVDESRSQSIGPRRERTDAALTQIQARLAGQKELELRVVRAGAGQGTGEGTRLFEAAERALADVPRQRVSAVVMLTDGQVHDAQREPDRASALPGPIHALITGDRGERDRRLVIEQSPSYGIVGKPQTMSIRVDDGPGITGTQARLEMRIDGGEPQTLRVPVGVTHAIEFTLEHGGQTIFELAVEAGPAELTLENNRTVAVVNGVRERLRVLLVTGEPHPGERTWRNLLKSDPAVDLVHFTILRPPEAQDFTPVNELSLIAFPIRELFEVKLNDFDLVIFDRYRRRDVLAQVYLDNIVRYVRGGGALMVAVGPNFGQTGNLFTSPLGTILPGAPTSIVHEQGFKPKVTELGERHPVTADLPGASRTEPSWGRWFRHVDTEPRRGQVLMSGVSERPLLLLDRVGDGRVAQIMSDHIWLWARGFEGGGPQAELLRRVAHWLMREPELEEEDLRAAVRGDRVEVTRRSIDATNRSVQMQLPSGQSVEVPMTETRPGRWVGTTPAAESGLYRMTDGTRSAITAVGALNPVEMADVRATEELVKTAAALTGGSVQWLADGIPEVRRVRASRDAAGRDPGGRGWIGFRANNDYIVTEVNQIPLLPGLAVLLIALATLVFAWRREGR